MNQNNNKNKKLNKIKRIFLGIAFIFIFLPCFLLTIGDGENIPDWDDLFHYFDIAPVLEDEDFIRFIDIGQGDSILISSNNQTALIDTGPPDSANELVKKLRMYGVEQIDMLFLTHIHSDHVGGAKELLNNFAVGNLIMPNIIDQPEGAEDALYAASTISENYGEVYTAMQGMVVNIGNFEITILAYFPELEVENDRSVILMVKNKDFKFLMMGDAEAKAEKRLIAESLDLKCNVLKVGHHGSSTSTTMDLIEATMPEYAVISCGYNNYFMHPHDETIGTLEKQHIEFYRTDSCGDVTCYIKDDKLDFKLTDKTK